MSRAAIHRARGGPLQGIRVLELTKVWAGPYAGKQLAYLGAEAIRIESMGSLDVTRTFGTDHYDDAPGFQGVNPLKLSAQINMKSPEGLKLLKELAAQCDILIENLRPGAIDRLGLGYEAVKAARPDIIYVSMGMYGNDGPLAYQTGYAPCFAALGGLSAQVGYADQPPAAMNIRYGDSTFGTMAAYAALVALLHRERTGAGQFVDLSAVETVSSMIGDTIMDYALNGHIPACDGNRHSDMAPHGTYRCGEGDWISIAAPTEAAWRGLCAAMGDPALADDPRFATLADRKSNEAELDERVESWTAGRDPLELTAELQAHGVAAAKSQNSVDMVADPLLWARGFYRPASSSSGRDKTIIGPSFILSDPAAVDEGAPKLGQHNDYVFGEILGLSAEERARLAETGVMR